MDNILQHIAYKLKLPAHKVCFNEVPYRHMAILPKVREINMSTEGYRRIAGDMIQNDNMARCYEECKKLSEFEHRYKEIEEFNKCALYNTSNYRNDYTQTKSSTQAWHLHHADALSSWPRRYVRARRCACKHLLGRLGTCQHWRR